MIRVRHEDAPTTRVPEQVKTYTNLAGSSHTKVLPEHDAPADPGWRAPVELTAAGRAAMGKRGTS